ncbi:MAG TPA: MFS transporter [Acidimicrobiales bacterium]|nr:MFS transporter [Acidimicrobiales bacterium]
MANQRRAFVVWCAGVAAYAVAVFQRSSLAVSGLAAQHRFHASAAELSLFAVLQLAVYAALQVPVGLLLDRWGPRRLIVTGAVVMAAGQAALAFSHSVPEAVAARVLVGGGDAMTFISVLRVVGVWFASPRVPLMTQLTGIIGQAGQVAAAYPLVRLLHSVGWTASFAGASAASTAAAAVALAFVRDAPAGTLPLEMHTSAAAVRRQLAEAWREPGTRIGVWTHFVSQFSGTVFALLWGYPFLVAGEGLSPGLAGGLISAMVFAGMGFGPLVGVLAGRWPRRRSAIVFGIVGGTAATWGVVLAWPGRAPVALLVLLVLVLATNGPGSLIGFDYARSYNPPTRMGSASGIVNVGGFVASLTTILVVGVILNLLGQTGPARYNLDGFRAALSFQYALWVLGAVMVRANRSRLRARLAAQGLTIDPLHRALVRKLR